MTSQLPGQLVSELPRPEYYVAKEVFGDGRIADAADGFETVLERARRLGDNRWIDSIPALVMLGECYYQQGNLQMALESYDAALMLALAYPEWVNRIQVPAEQLPALENIPKGIDWFPKSSSSRPVVIPEAVQLTVDLALGAADNQSPQAATAIGVATRLDATEVIRTLGLALLRRYQTLGPLAAHSPLVAPLDQYFSRPPSAPAAWLQSSWSVLRGLNQLAMGSDDAVRLLRTGRLLGNQFEYFLTPMSMLSLAEVESRQGNYQAAISLLQEASLVSAYFGQDFELAMSLQDLAANACASRRTELLPAVQQAATWCTKKSGLAFVAASIGAAEMAVYSAQLGQADRLLKQANTVLRMRDIVLPRFNAHASYVNALLAFSQNRAALGIPNLDSALRLRRGNAQTGPTSERAFQAQMTLNLLAENAISAMTAEALLDNILAEPSAIDWELNPLGALATITTASLPAYERHLELAVQQAVDQRAVKEIVRRVDRLQRERLYEALPLGGRLLAWRHVIAATAPGSLPQPLADHVRGVQQSSAQLRTESQQIAALVDALRAGPLPLDERQIPASAKRQYAELEELATAHESQLTLRAISRIPLERLLPVWPAMVDPEFAYLEPSDALLAFATTGQSVFGICVQGQQVQYWQVDQRANIDKLLGQLLLDIGLKDDSPRPDPSAITKADAAWRATSLQLRDLLIPQEIQQAIDSAERLIVVPNGKLWYLPFELLPDAGNRNSPWLARKAITYVPTLGSAFTAFRRQAALQPTVGLMGKFFSLDATTNQQLADALALTTADSSSVSLTQKITVPSADWLRISSRQMWIAARVPILSKPLESVLLPLGPGKQSTLGSWLESPLASPKNVFLAGMRTSAGSPQLANGDDLLLPACGLLFSGSDAAVLSRWPAGGRSTAHIMTRFFEERQQEPHSNSLRRALLAEWPRDYLVAEEPVLLPTARDSEPLTLGAHPLLWAGYMSLGDTRIPSANAQP
ncbi:MAG: CHAT domain-containing protein [bacterium]|nr:CHAT domain-containing protein [bacterium]